MRLLCLTLAIAGSATAAGGTTNATVYYSAEKGFTLVAGKIDTAGAAYGQLVNGSVEGWSTLDIKANPTGAAGNASRAMQAMGELESALSCWHIALFAINNDDRLAGKDEKVADFVTRSHAWTRENAMANSSTYWTAVRGVLAQFDGIVDGYAKHCSGIPQYIALSQHEMLYMQMDGDLEDIQSAYGVERPGRRLQTAATGQDGQDDNARDGGVVSDGLRCTMLAKLAPDNSDVWFGHATWDSYANMAPRIYKTYTFPVIKGSDSSSSSSGSVNGSGSTGGQVAMQTVSFSSSPSWLSSIDDWYLTTGLSKLAVIETSHSINNHALYSKLRPETVSSWIRVIVANALATDGGSWADTFSVAHSGTYNNQWQVVDMNKFTPHAAPAPGLLTILEEVPGTIQADDMTAHLTAEKFWPSFNVPFFPAIQKAAGYSPSDWSGDKRHCLLAALQESVASIETMEAVMRHNDYKHDACSNGDACTGAVDCRADLEPGAQMFGALDAKWASYTSIVKDGNKAYAQMGPTHDTQPVFCWKKFTPVPHHGHPECFDFDTAVMSPLSL